jgi:putative dehydrogenase
MDASSGPGPGRTVGVIGLGRMGLPIAENLLDSGFDVVGYCRSGCPAFVEAGGAMGASPAEVAERSDVLMSILPGTSEVEEVITGPGGTLAGLRAGAVHIEMSTIDPAVKHRLRDAVRSAGGDLLDAPISGSPAMVRPRRATTFASGDPDAVVRVADVLGAVSGPWVSTGELGTGAHLKYISSMLVAAHTVAAAEALVMAQRSGMDLDLVLKTLDGSIAGSALLAQRGPLMAERAWTPAPGPVETLHAILEQVDRYVAELGMPAPVFTSAKAVFDKAVADGWSQLDIACVHDQISGQQALTEHSFAEQA